LGDVVVNTIWTKIGIGVVVVACLLLIVLSTMYYTLKDNREEDIAVATETSNGLWQTPAPKPSVEPSPSVNISPTEEPKDSAVIPETIATPEIVLGENREEDIAKMWFDLRGENASLDLMNMLVSSIAGELDKGIVPQVVARFPLSLIDSTDFGFQHNTLYTPEGSVNIITMVAPPTISVGDRTVLFVTSEPELGAYKTDVYVDVDMVISNIGRAKVANDFYFFLGGEVFDESILTDNGSIGLLSVKTDGKSTEMVSFDSSFDSLENTTSLLKDNAMYLQPDSKGFAPFFYTEVENEGQSTDELYLVTTGPDNTVMYEIGVKEGLVQATVVR
jgi:hypothetical protein